MMGKVHKEQQISFIRLTKKRLIMSKQEQSLEKLIVEILNWKKNIRSSKSVVKDPNTVEEKLVNGFRNFIKSPFSTN